MIDKSLLEKYKNRYDSDPSNKAAQYAIANEGFKKASLNKEVQRRHNYVFSEETKRGKITDQKSSGRCWMFAALNTARVTTMDNLNIENFEYSQVYPFFFEKLERANFFLECILDCANQDRTSREVWHLLNDPIGDGGQWEMFAGMLRKYGAVPKEVMPETFNSSNTGQLNMILENKLREFAYVLRELVAKGASKEEIKAKKEEQLYFVYNVLVKALGEPPVTFDYSYRDKDDNFHRIENITPQEFFNKYSGMDVSDMVSFINSPTEDKPFNKTYTVKYLGSIAEEKPVKYLNIPIEDMKQIAINSIKDGYPVWFGCDVGKQSDNKLGIMDTDLFAYADTLGEDLKLDKAQRLDYSVSLMTHAMVLVGVDLDKDGKPLTWKVENSWGKDTGDEGIFSMSDEWFNEYMYQITVPSRYVPEELLEQYKQETVVLEPWDPMGALAWLN